MNVAKNSDVIGFSEGQPQRFVDVSSQIGGAISGLERIWFTTTRHDLDLAKPKEHERFAVYNVLTTRGKHLIDPYEMWRFEAEAFHAASRLMSNVNASTDQTEFGSYGRECWERRLDLFQRISKFEDRGGIPSEKVDELAKAMSSSHSWTLAPQITTNSDESEEFYQSVRRRNIAFSSRLIGEVLLPRYMITESWRCARRVSASVKWGRFLGASAVLTGVALVLGALGYGAKPGLIASQLGLLSLCVLTCILLAGVVGGETVSQALLLRPIAAAAVGWALLITIFNSDKIFHDKGAPWWSSIVLAGLVLCYLSVEARLNGVEKLKDLAGRVAVVWMFAVVYAVLVATTICGLVLPTLRGTEWPLLSQGNEYAWFVAMTAGASLLVGAIIQVLWDDRPITAPLGRRVWRSGS
jgi:hypothetical protein